MEKRFHLKEHGTTVRTEIMAGITTFMAMAYILMVNAGMFASLGTVSYGAIYIATAISAVIGTVLIGLLSNLPLAQASGMGLNAFFVYTVCFGFGLSYANALVLVLVDGIIFVLLTVTGLRKMIFDAIPAAVKTAISAGIGLFIAFIGLQNAGIVVDDGATLVNLASFNVFTGEATWASIFPMLITLIAVFVIGALSKKKVKGAVLWGMLGSAVLYYVIGLITVPEFYATNVAPNLTSDFFGAFKDFGAQAFGKVFTEGFNFSPYIAEHGTGNFVTAGFATNCNYGYEWPREAHTMSPLGQGYKCRDGRYIYVFVNDYTSVWPKFAKALRLPEEVVTDPRFTTKESTTIIANRSALVDIIREYALKRDAQDILDELVAYDVPSCILNQYKDRFSGEWLEQSVSNGYLIEHTYPSGNKTYLAQMPIYFDSLGVQDLYAQHRALGADNEAIEKEFGDGE